MFAPSRGQGALKRRVDGTVLDQIVGTMRNLPNGPEPLIGGDNAHMWRTRHPDRNDGSAARAGVPVVQLSAPVGLEAHLWAS